MNVGNVSALDDNNSIDCYWSGEGPICDGKCRPGETVASHKNDGNIIHTNLFNLFQFIQNFLFRKWLHHWQEKV